MFQAGDKVVCIDASLPGCLWDHAGTPLVKDALYIIDGGEDRVNGDAVFLRGMTHYSRDWDGEIPWLVERFRKLFPPRSRKRVVHESIQG